MKHKLIVFDMDGVIFKHKNFWMVLHKKLGTEQEGYELTKKYLKTNYKKLVEEVPGRLWKGREAQPYFDIIESMQYEEGAQEVLKTLKKRGYKTAIISSGPKHAALRVKEECGLDYYHTHDLIIKDNTITGEYHYDDYEDKAKQLKEFSQEANCKLGEIVFVGHAHNDIKGLEAAGLGIGYRPDKDVAAITDVNINHLKELLDIIN